MADPTVRGGRLTARFLGARTMLFALGGSYVLGFAAVLAGLSGSQRAMAHTVGPFLLAYSAVAAGYAVRAGRHPHLDRRRRRGWQLMAAAFVLLVTACVGLAVTQSLPFPTMGDALRLVFVPVLLAGLLTLPARPHTSREAKKLTLDIGIVLAGGAILLWYLVLGEVVTNGSPGLVTVAAASYPIGDLALIFGATNVLLRSSAPASRVPLVLLAGAVTCLVVGDVYLGYQRAHSPTGGYTGWQFLCRLTGHFLMAVAAVEQCRRADGATVAVDAPPRIRAVPRLPYAAIAVGYALMLVVTAGLPLHPYGGIIIGVVAMTCLVVARQVVALRENHELAITDSLTGLANRTLLRHELDRALERGRRTGQRVGVLLIDLNGFKQINDTLGHETGDETLVAFARLLERSVRRSDCVARLGGDEFAIVVHRDDAAANTPIIANRIAEGTHTPLMVGGHLLRPGASIGLAISDPAESTVSELLHRADADMYRVKRANAAGSPRGRRPADRRDDITPVPANPTMNGSLHQSGGHVPVLASDAGPPDR